MDLKIALVPHGKITLVVPSLIQYLQKSEAWTRGRATVDDIVGFIYSGRMQLWLVYDPTDLRGYGYVISEVKEYPRCKMLVIQYCAGEPNHMQFVEDVMHRVLESFAKDAGCAGIEYFGRPGWKQHVKKYGYDIQTVVYERIFGETP
jgi:hypothetical protein